MVPGSPYTEKWSVTVSVDEADAALDGEVGEADGSLPLSPFN